MALALVDFAGTPGQHAAIDRVLDRLIPQQPRFSLTRYYDVDAERFVVTSVWDHATGTFHDAEQLKGQIVTGLLAAFGLEVS